MSSKRCPYHPEMPVAFQCADCGKFFCFQCMREISGQHYCRGCKERRQPTQYTLREEQQRHIKPKWAVAAISCCFTSFILFGISGSDGFHAAWMALASVFLIVGIFCGGKAGLHGRPGGGAPAP